MKNVILTGSSDGLGREFGKLCVEDGSNVIALCRTEPDYKCDFIKTDLSDEKSIFHEKYTGKEIEHPEEWMNPADIAKLMLYILNLPKSIEISDIIINRKSS